MNKETKEALEKSIQKWIDIRDNDGEDFGNINCALCILNNEECVKCIIHLKNDKKIGCGDTPFEKWFSHQRNTHKEIIFPFKRHNDCQECEEIINEEIEFLKSLREE